MSEANANEQSAYARFFNKGREKNNNFEVIDEFNKNDFKLNKITNIDFNLMQTDALFYSDKINIKKEYEFNQINQNQMDHLNKKFNK